MQTLNTFLASEGLRGLMARRPLTAFLVLMLLTAWPIMWLIPLTAHGVVPWGDVSRLISLGVIGAMMGGALLVTWAEEGVEGIRRFIARIFRWRFSLLWWALVLLALPVAAVVCDMAFGHGIKTGEIGSVFFAAIWGCLKGLLAINLWEESVWMGFFQTRLERRHNFFIAALITAAPFSLAHLPLEFTREITLSGFLSSYLVLCGAAVIFRLMGAAVLRGASDSLLAVGFMHAMFNQVTQPGGILATLAPGVDPVPAAVTALVVVLPVYWWCARGKLSRAYRLDVLERGLPSNTATATAAI